jgi:hypothetical protein
VSSAIDSILSTQSSANAPPDSSVIANQIMAALESSEIQSPPSVTGAAVDASGDNSPGVFIMRMPPSDRQLKELAARRQQQPKHPSLIKEISSFTFTDVPTLADFDIAAIASDPSLQAM